jgi:hypothetical protein
VEWVLRHRTILFYCQKCVQIFSTEERKDEHEKNCTKSISQKDKIETLFIEEIYKSTQKLTNNQILISKENFIVDDVKVDLTFFNGWVTLKDSKKNQMKSKNLLQDLRELFQSNLLKEELNSWRTAFLFCKAKVNSAIILKLIKNFSQLEI